MIIDVYDDSFYSIIDTYCIFIIEWNMNYYINLSYNEKEDNLRKNWFHSDTIDDMFKMCFIQDHE